ncbi:MAG: hypothetical protein KME30_04855 [Iphinoe sp. HA4291-MV1]|nr:hypothetical protein [Iphinoe sp. HA4291-MV1]
MSVATTVAIILTGLGITARPAKSAVLALSDNNSIAAFEPSFSNNPTNNGILFWTVDDVNQLFQNTFWYRVGSGGSEKSINSLNLIDLIQPSANQISATYAGTDFKIAIDYRLNGNANGSGISNLLENITIQNTGNTGSNPLDFHFFNYTDFDLNENSTEDTVTIGRGITTVSDSITLAKEVVTPANRYQLAPVFDILNSLEDDAPTTLTNFSGPLTGDTAYAFEWDFTLAPGESFSITANKSISRVPEPTMTPSLIGFSGLMLLCWLYLTQIRSKKRFRPESLQ